MFFFPETCSRRQWMLAASGLTLQMAKGQELRRMAPPSGQKPDPALASLLAQMQKIVAARDHAA